MAKSKRKEDSEEEDEEEFEDEREEEVSDDDEEDARKGRAGGSRQRQGKGKRAPGNAFIDDAAEEDDDEDEGVRRVKRSRFIDDIAEVDEDEEDDDYEEDGVDDLIANEAEDVAAEEDFIARRRRDADLAAARDQEVNPEALAQWISEKYAGQSYFAEGDVEEGGAVAQQALLPTPTDPKLWVVRCAEGAERETVVCLMQKSYDLAAKGAPLLIKSALCHDHLKGYFYVEALRESHVTEALTGLRAVFHSKKPRMVPLGEMTAALATAAPKRRALAPDAWVRFRAGAYKGDLAQVLRVEGDRATVRCVPRLDYAALGAKARGEEEAKGRGGSKLRPRARPFSAEEAGAQGLDVQTARDRSLGTQIFILNGSQRFADGLLVRNVAAGSLIPEKEVPPLDELAPFSARGADGSAAAASEALADLVQQGLAGLGEEGAAAAAAASFAPGARVVVLAGDLKGIAGVVDRVEATGLVMVKPQDARLPGFDELVGFAPAELAKHVQAGDHVRVASGGHRGVTGLVVDVQGAVATLFADVTRTQVRVFVRDLADAGGAGGAADTLGAYALHDLVSLDAATAGVIVGIDADACRVLTNQGRPEKPDVRVCTLGELKQNLNDRRASAQDGGRNEVGRGDLVEVVDGPLRGKSGTVRFVVRGMLFLQVRELPEHAGFTCVPARHCRVRGGTRPAAAGPGGMAGALATPARHAFGSHAGGMPMASPARAAFGGGGGAGGGGYGARVSRQGDRLLEGKLITIRQGPYRGMRGRVISATPTHLRLELEAQMKTVTVSRSHVRTEDGGGGAGMGADASRSGLVPGFGGYSGAASREHAAPLATATPAHRMGVPATPAHWSATGATPLHPGVGAATPAYEPAWALATPAHAGVREASPPPVEGGGAERWVGVEVELGGRRGVVAAAEGAAAARVRWGGGDEEVRALVQLRPVPGAQQDRVRLLFGEAAGAEGELVGTDGGDGIIKVDNGDIKIWELANVGRVAVA